MIIHAQPLGNIVHNLNINKATEPQVLPTIDSSPSEQKNQQSKSNKQNSQENKQVNKQSKKAKKSALEILMEED